MDHEEMRKAYLRAIGLPESVNPVRLMADPEDVTPPDVVWSKKEDEQ